MCLFGDKVKFGACLNKLSKLVRTIKKLFFKHYTKWIS